MGNDSNQPLAEGYIKVKLDMTEVRELLLALVAAIDEYEQKHD